MKVIDIKKMVSIISIKVINNMVIVIRKLVINRSMTLIHFIRDLESHMFITMLINVIIDNHLMKMVISFKFIP